MTFGGGGCKLKTQCSCENYPRHYKLSPCHCESITRHPESTSRHSERSEESNRKLKQESKKNSSCHPEERSELRILPEKNARQERWSDSEQTQSSPHPTPLPRRGKRRNITSSPSGANFDGHAESQTQCPCEGLTLQGAHSAEQTIEYRLREEVKIQDRGKQPYEQQRITDAGEGWQNQNHVNDNNKINCHPEALAEGSKNDKIKEILRSFHSPRMTKKSSSE